MAIPKPIKRYTVQEYYALETAAAYKSEYFNGEIFAMAGGTREHSRICINLAGELRNRLAGRPCEPFESNLRLRIKPTGLITYPDASVYCGPMERDADDSHAETFTNPTVIFEVLSKSTEAYDRGQKWRNYRRIDSLRTYILVSQTEPLVEILERSGDGPWQFREVSGLDALVAIPSIRVELPMSELYARVVFSDAEAVTEPVPE